LVASSRCRGVLVVRKRAELADTSAEGNTMKTMKVARLHGFGEPMKIEEVEIPKPRPTDVLIKVKACGVVPNLTNVLKFWREWFPELPLPRLPAVFGLDVSGEIAEVGSHVQVFRPRQRVYVTPGLFCGSCPACRADDTTNCANFTFSGYFGFGPDSQRQYDAYPYGGMGEYMVAPQHNLVLLPDNVTFEQAARFGYLGTAYAALRKAEVGPGTTILVNGATGVLGLGAVLIALGRGATRVLGTARDRTRLDKLKRIAGDRFEYFVLSEGASVVKWARDFTANHGIDVVVDCLGPGSSGQLLMEPIYALRRGGKAVNIGGVGEKTVMDIHWMMDQQIAFIGSCWFSTKDGMGLAEMARAGSLDLSVYEPLRVPLAEVNRAIDGSQPRDGGFTNLVIVP
jgi:threonine dehydrogenase-like Zn-dependent dehydrogenase